jgi:hypothetical protein
MRYFGRKGDAELVPMYPALNYGSSVADWFQSPQAAAMNKASNFQNVSQPKVSPQAAAVGLGAILAVGALNTFVVAPLIIKAFKPDFSYGRRVGISLGLSAGVAIVRGLILAAKKGS